MENNIIIGQIIKAVGIKGEIKIQPLTNDMRRYNLLEEVYIENAPYQIMSCRFDKAFVFLKLNGIDTREKAESLIGEYLEIGRNEAIIPEGGYLIVDIIGCRFYLNDGTEIGVVTDVAQYGAADVFTIEGEDGVCRCPFLKKIIVRIDIQSKTIIADKKQFQAVCVYED